MNYKLPEISKYYSYDNRYMRRSRTTRNSIDKYEIIGELGRGSYGRVLKVRNKLTEKIYAMKKIPISSHDKDHNNYLINELKILSYNRSKYLLRAHEIFVDSECVCIIMDHADKGDLRRFIRRNKIKKNKIDEEMIWHILIQICIGIDYLHSNNIIHRDIKTANIMMDHNNLVMLGDFGVSKILKPQINLANTRIGTPYYLSPEIVKGEKYTKKIDIWALGCILCEMITLDYAFLSENIHALNYKIVQGKYNLENSNYSPVLINLVKKMLNTNIAKRPDIGEIMAMKEIKDRMSGKKYVIDTINTNSIKRKISRYIPIPKNDFDWGNTINKINEDVCFNSPRVLRPTSVFNRRERNLLPPIKIC